MRRKNTVLVVEDDPDCLEFTTMALRQSGLVPEIAVARDGAEALDYLFAEGPHASRDVRDRPALILLDLKLPKLSGHDVLQRIRQDPRTDTIPVVVLTSSGEDGDIEASYRYGANSFVRKPVDFDRFNEQLRDLQVYWLKVNESV
ncbi:MAG: response regulator [Ramlibacter sp.]